MDLVVLVIEAQRVEHEVHSEAHRELALILTSRGDRSAPVPQIVPGPGAAQIVPRVHDHGATVAQDGLEGVGAANTPDRSPQKIEGVIDGVGRGELGQRLPGSTRDSMRRTLRSKSSDSPPLLSSMISIPPRERKRLRAATSASGRGSKACSPAR